MHNFYFNIYPDFYEKVTAMKTGKRKVLLALGGWNDSEGDKYSRMVNSPKHRKNFINTAVDFLQENNFDGLDLDWEYPVCWQVDCSKGPASDRWECFCRGLEQL